MEKQAEAQALQRTRDGLNDNMQSNSAKNEPIQVEPNRRVVILIYPGVTLLDVAGPAQTFSSANNVEIHNQRFPYQVYLASLHGGPVMTDSGIEMTTVSLTEAAGEQIDTLIVAGGNGVFDVLEERQLVDWILKQSSQCRRTASTCMGSFLIAETGLLDGQRVTTHWRQIPEMRRRYPNIRVEKEPLFVRNGHLWSSAGVTAGIDLALAMVEEDMGHDAAMQVAQALVVFFKRPGGQPQFSNVLMAQTQDDDGTFSELHAWIMGNLQNDLSVENLARRVAMSPRTFSRLYKKRTGCTPAKSVEMMRVDAAKRKLERGIDPLATVAFKSGFNDEQGLRRAFRRHVGISPSDYRDKFSSRRAS